jgi:uncharacterized protein YbjT (DUF2867 family)
MILVTSSAGLTGRTVISALAASGHRVRALIRRAEQAAVVTEAGAADVAVADLLDAAAIRRAMAGAEDVYFVCPRMSKDEPAIGAAMIHAATAAGVRHFVYHSAIHAQLVDMPHHAGKLRVEKALIESRLDYTILQPARYMQNTLTEWPRITGRGVYHVPYSPDVAMCLVDLEDVAAVAAAITGVRAHFGATYGLDGPESLSAAQEAAILTDVLGHPVTARQVPIDEWRRAAEKIRTASQIDYMLKMFAFYDRHGLRGGNPNVLTWILGRAPATYRAFVVKTARPA